MSDISHNTNDELHSLREELAQMRAQINSMHSSIPNNPTQVEAPRAKNLVIPEELEAAMPSIDGKHFFIKPSDPDDDHLFAETANFPKKTLISSITHQHWNFLSLVSQDLTKPLTRLWSNFRNDKRSPLDLWTSSRLKSMPESRTLASNKLWLTSYTLSVRNLQLLQDRSTTCVWIIMSVPQELSLPLKRKKGNISRRRISQHASKRLQNLQKPLLHQKRLSPIARISKGEAIAMAGMASMASTPQQGQQQAGQQQYQPAYTPYVQQAATNPGYQTQAYTDNSGQSAQQNFQQGGRGRGRGRGSARQ
ncbi:hypothetical protein BGX20_004276 [Mortierella sp. AD010]|nr:hypothetical protein BGX20_004276 [Mortierella sp. AD010]